MHEAPHDVVQAVESVAQDEGREGEKAEKESERGSQPAVSRIRLRRARHVNFAV